MNISTLQPIDDNCPFPFFEDEQNPPEKPRYKIYNDGGHYIATRCVRSQIKPPEHTHKKEAIDILFDSLYYAGLKEGLKGETLTEYIKTGILKLFPDTPKLDGYIADKLERKGRNYWSRLKRFKRKANLNKWNYFVTFTYDDKKQTADSFRRKLRKCLSNLHTRRGWRYMGVFEYAPDTGRLHFHGLLYVPDGEMIGRITEIQDYDTRKGQMQTAHINSFFAANFGRNDFNEVTEMELKHGQRINYILKYIGKTGERIVYSRGIPTEVYARLDDTDIITEYTDFVTKYVLFDNIIDWERDVLRHKQYKQVTMIDIICNPPRAVA